MTNFLSKIINALPFYQQSAVRSLVERKKKTGEIKGQRQFSDELTSIQRSLSSRLGKVILDPKYAIENTKISSEDHNSNMESIFLDLNALYKTIEDLSRANEIQAISLNSEYLKSKAAIEKLLNDVRVFSLRKRYPDYNEVKVIDFNSSKNISRSSPIAPISGKVRLLELKTVYSSRAHLVERTNRSTKVYTKTYSSGIKGTLSKNFAPEKMVDQKAETFWGHLILSDIPITQVFERTTSSGEPYQVDANGPVVEIYFKFSHIEKLNTIRLLPFGDFPITILDIGYRPTSNSKIFYPIKGFIKSTTLDWEEYNFDSVYAHEVRITISQENYKSLVYHLPKRIVTGTDIFQKIFEKRTKDIIGNRIFDSDKQLEFLSTLDSYTTALNSLQQLTNLSSVDSISQPDTVYLETYMSLISEVYKEIDPDIGNTLIQQYFNQEAIQDEESIVEINKYEYLLGMREVEITYEAYGPIAYYESEKFNLQATPSEVVIEVDDSHVDFKTQWQDDYRKTSIEWDIDIGDGRRLPIHPKNIVDNIDSIPATKDERLFIDRSSLTGYSRLGSYYSTPYRVKKDGEVIPVEKYTATREASGIPKLKIVLVKEWFNENSIYTIDYAVSSDSYSIDILNSFSSRTISSPEIITEFGTDNDVTLAKFPFINYEVINSSFVFEKNEAESKWTFIPEQANQYSGQISIYPTIIDSVGSILQLGNTTGQNITGVWGVRSGENPVSFGSNPELAVKYFSPISGIDFGYFIQGMDSPSYAKVESFGTNTFVLTSPLEVTYDQIAGWSSLASGQVFVGTISGDSASGYLQIDYTLGIGVTSDDTVYALGNVTYEPMIVRIGGKKSKNITNYETLIHPAFSVANKKDTEYEYIQAGNKLYFSQAVSSQEVTVEYNWVAEYLQILGKLRCNKQVNPDLTPKVDEIRVLINNMVI